MTIYTDKDGYVGIIEVEYLGHKFWLHFMYDCYGIEGYPFNSSGLTDLRILRNTMTKPKMEEYTKEYTKLLDLDYKLKKQDQFRILFGGQIKEAEIKKRERLSSHLQPLRVMLEIDKHSKLINICWVNRKRLLIYKDIVLRRNLNKRIRNPLNLKNIKENENWLLLRGGLSKSITFLSSFCEVVWFVKKFCDDRSFDYLASLYDGGELEENRREGC